MNKLLTVTEIVSKLILYLCFLSSPLCSFVANIYAKVTGPGCSNVVFVAVIEHSTGTFTQENKNQTRVPRRTSRVTNLLLMRENIRLSSLTLGSSQFALYTSTDVQGLLKSEERLLCM